MYNDLLEILKNFAAKGYADLSELTTTERLELAIAYYKDIDNEKSEFFYFFFKATRNAYLEDIVNSETTKIVQMFEPEYQKLRQGGNENG